MTGNYRIREFDPLKSILKAVTKQFHETNFLVCHIINILLTLVGYLRESWYKPHKKNFFPRPSVKLHIRVLGPVVQRLDNAIQRISVNKTNHAIRWIVIYPVDSVIQPLNNRGQVLSCCHRKRISQLLQFDDQAMWQHPRENPREVHESERISVIMIRMAQFVLNIEKLSHIIGARGSQDLRSPSPMMAPEFIKYLRSQVHDTSANWTGAERYSSRQLQMHNAKPNIARVINEIAFIWL